jgi:small-conductance mechanosensitive channel
MEWLQHIIQDRILYHLLVAAIIVAAFFLLSTPVKRLISWIGGKIVARTETRLDDLIIEVVRKNIRLLMVVTGLHIAVREIRKGLTAGDVTAHQILDYADAMLYIAVVLVILKIVQGIVRVFITWYLEKLSNGGSVQLRLTLAPLTTKIMNLVIGLVAIIIILDHFGVNIGSLLVSLGVGSLAVALAAQDTLANMIAGFVLLVDRPFRVGDRIELPSGQVGDVQQIGLRSTRILNFDNNLIIVPNSDLVKGRIINYAYPHNQMRIMLKVAVAYGEKPSEVRSILLSLASSHPDIVSDPPPEVFFTAMNDSAIEFTLVARASDFMKRFKAECDLREHIYTKFAEAGIEIPFPQRVVHMKTTA